MALAVVTVAAGGLPVVDATASGLGLPVSEMPAQFGLAVTKVASGGRPVVYAPANSDGSPPVTPLFTAFDPASATDTALSNNNLTATHSLGTANTGVKSAKALSSGKYYFEITRGTASSSDAIGLVTTTGTYGNVTGGTNCTAVFSASGNISSNNASSGKNIAGINAGNIIGIAVDLTARKAWFRKSPAGNWNGLAIGSEDPVAGLGGVVVAPTVSFLPVVAWGSGASGVYTANFGVSAFSGAVPSGFTAGWPA